LRGKLGGLPPGPAALLLRTRPNSNGKTAGTDTVFAETVMKTATETDMGTDAATAT